MSGRPLRVSPTSVVSSRSGLIRWPACSAFGMAALMGDLAVSAFYFFTFYFLPLLVFVLYVALIFGHQVVHNGPVSLGHGLLLVLYTLARGTPYHQRVVRCAAPHARWTLRKLAQTLADHP